MGFFGTVFWNPSLTRFFHSFFLNSITLMKMMERNRYLFLQGKLMCFFLFCTGNSSCQPPFRVEKHHMSHNKKNIFHFHQPGWLRTGSWNNGAYDINPTELAGISSNPLIYKSTWRQGFCFVFPELVSVSKNTSTHNFQPSSSSSSTASSSSNHCVSAG